MEAAAAAAAGVGVAPEKTATSGVASMLMHTGQSVALLQSSLFILLVFILAFPVNVFTFSEE